MTLRRIPRMFLIGRTACTDGFLESIQVAGAVASLRLNVKGIHGREYEVTIRPPRPKSARSKSRMSTGDDRYELHVERMRSEKKNRSAVSRNERYDR